MSRQYFSQIFGQLSNSQVADAGLEIVKINGLQAALDAKLALAGGTMTGDLVLAQAPTSDLHAATKKYVDDSVSGLVDAAPGALDTLNELAAALGDDANFSTTVTNALAAKAPIASPTFTGVVTLAQAPTQDLEAATKKYVDDSIAASQTALSVNTTPSATADLQHDYQVLNASQTIDADNMVVGKVYSIECTGGSTINQSISNLASFKNFRADGSFATSTGVQPIKDGQVIAFRKIVDSAGANVVEVL